jgi:hypothetical protein
MKPRLCLWFSKQLPKEIIAPTNQRLAAANDMMHCFSLHPAKFARLISIKQAHDMQVLLHRSMSHEDRNYYFWLMPT